MGVSSFFIYLFLDKNMRLPIKENRLKSYAVYDSKDRNTKSKMIYDSFFINKKNIFP